jgi:hypothetical protein
MTPEGQRSAYADGWKSGRTDSFVGRRSDYAWYGMNLDPTNTYSYFYSLGYRAAWRAR